MSKSQLVQQEERQAIAPVVTDSAAIMQVISKAASDPNTDVDKLERMMAMYERMENRKAEAAFNAALSKLQSELPQITESGKIIHNGKLISEYAKWDEDIHPVLRPLLLGNGFSLSFRVDTGNGIRVEAVLAHVLGHSERTSITLPSDTSGAKNAVQAIASSVSYGKRYTAGALLNFATGGQDDDGQAAGGPPRISEEQIANLEALITEVGADKAAFLKYMQADSLDRIQAKSYGMAVKALEKKRGGK